MCVSGKLPNLSSREEKIEKFCPNQGGNSINLLHRNTDDAEKNFSNIQIS